MAKKRTGRYEDHPEVITGAPRPVVERQVDARPVRSALPSNGPEGSSIVVTITDGVARYLVEVPALLIHDGYRSDLR